MMDKEQHKIFISKITFKNRSLAPRGYASSQERYHERNHATSKKSEREILQQMSTKMQQQSIEWRRSKVMELLR